MADAGRINLNFVSVPLTVWNLIAIIVLINNSMIAIIIIIPLLTTNHSFKTVYVL